MNIKTKWNFHLPFEVSGNKQKIKIVIRHVPKCLEKTEELSKWGYPVFHLNNLPVDQLF